MSEETKEQDKVRSTDGQTYITPIDATVTPHGQERTPESDELKEIESLYQVANKNWKTDKEKGTDRKKGKASLKELLSKYDKANRTGCALLYLGQMSNGEEREKYLKQAIEGFSDSYYGNGVQVGAYARYYLAYYYKETGDKKKAETICDEINKDYPNAVTHSGKPLSAGVDKLLKELQ